MKRVAAVVLLALSSAACMQYEYYDRKAGPEIRERYRIHKKTGKVEKLVMGSNPEKWVEVPNTPDASTPP